MSGSLRGPGPLQGGLGGRCPGERQHWAGRGESLLRTDLQETGRSGEMHDGKPCLAAQ